MALVLSLAGTLVRTAVFELHVIAVLGALFACVWFVSIETLWFHRAHRQSLGRGFGNAALAFVQSFLLTMAFGVLLG